MDWKEWIKQYGTREIAEKCGVSYEAVRKWLKGITEPSKSNILKIVELSGGEVTFEDFFHSKDNN